MTWIERVAVAGGVAALLTAAEGHARGWGSDVPAPGAGRGSIGITVEYEVKWFHTHEAAMEVYFVPVQEDADRLAGDSFVTSNLNSRRHGQSYLLNAKPGRYVAVAALLPSANGKGSPYKAFFSAEMIPLTEVIVAAGGLAFAGEYLVTLDNSFAEADPAQQHYFPRIAPRGAAQKGTVGRLFVGEVPYRATLKTSSRDAGAERAFWSAARAKIFDDRKDWQELIDRRLQELGRAP